MTESNKDIYASYVSNIDDLGELITKVITELKEKKILKHLIKFRDLLSNVDAKNLKEIAESCSELRINPTYETLEYLKDPDKGVWEEVDDIELGIKELNVNIVDLIPDPPYDVDAVGTLDDLQEIRNFYITAVISSILKDEFSAEFNLRFKNFLNSKKILSVDDDMSFTVLLQRFQRLNSAIITMLVSACLIKISEKRETGDSIKIKGLSTEEYSDLRRTIFSVKEINRSWSTRDGALTQEKVTKLTKLEILTLLNEKEKEIHKAIESSRFPNLFKINSINPDSLSPIVKQRIELCIESQLKGERKNYQVKEFNNIASRIRRKANKLACVDLIAQEMAKYRELGSKYKFKTKQ